MAPKGSKRKQDGGNDTAIQVKKEKNEPTCIAGRSGQALQNAIQYRLKKKTTPEYIRKAYRSQVKHSKGMSKTERAAFLEKLLDEDWDAEVFERWRSVEHQEEEGLKVDEETAAKLTPYQKQQYLHSQGKQANRTVHKNGGQCQRQDEDAGEEGAVEEPEGENDANEAHSTKVLETRAKLRGSHHNFTRAALDLDFRIKAYVDNEYVGKVAAECQKACEALQQTAAQVAMSVQTANDGLDHDDSQLDAWATEADSFSEVVRSLKARIQSMRTFAMKAAPPE